MKLESNSTTVVQLHDILLGVRDTLKQRRSDCFYGSKVNAILEEIDTEKKNRFLKEADKFLERSICYLEKHYDFEKSVFKFMKCLNFEKNDEIKWGEISLLSKILKINIDEDALYEDFCSLKTAISYIQAQDIKETDKKWALFFRKQDAQELMKVVSFVLSVPLSNAYTERIFSHMGSVWSKERNRMSLGLVKSELQIRLNFNESCLDFSKFLETPNAKELLVAAKSNSKYTWKQKPTLTT